MDYYAKMTEEAAFREQRAMWHVRRRRLDAARINFMQAEEAALMEQMQQAAPALLEATNRHLLTLSPLSVDFYLWLENVC